MTYSLAIQYQNLAHASGIKARRNLDLALAAPHSKQAATALEFAKFWQRLAAEDHARSVAYMSE